MEHLSLFSHGTLWGMCLFEPMRHSQASQLPPLAANLSSHRLPSCSGGFWLYTSVLPPVVYWAALHPVNTQHVQVAAGHTDDGLKLPGWWARGDAKSATFNLNYSYIQYMCEHVCELCSLCSWSQTLFNMTHNYKKSQCGLNSGSFFIALVQTVFTDSIISHSFTTKSLCIHTSFCMFLVERFTFTFKHYMTQNCCKWGCNVST